MLYSTLFTDRSRIKLLDNHLISRNYPQKRKDYFHYRESKKKEKGKGLILKRICGLLLSIV
jgi:hypothetical protein